ncbi:MAG TPA: DHA2 family efflux MFS transporter permease subunit [Acidimicrobiales bacterium]|nr:DHA2 family efflux MFS transporter permease subunit [Acidimicrobiales bacterium]
MTALTGGSEPPPNPPSPAPARRTAVFAVTAVAAFMASLDLSIVNVAFPALERSFVRAGQAELAWVITAYAIVFASLLVTAGRTADRLGRRRLFFIGLAVFTAGSALCGLAPDLPVLVSGRAVQGSGAALLLPASLGLLLDAFPQESRSQAVALWAGVGALAVATGPSLGAALISAGGWRWAFFVNLPVGAAAALLGRRVLPPGAPRQAPASPDYPGVVLVSAALAGVVLAISQGSDWGWTDPRVLAAGIAAVALGIAFIRRCATHPEPVLDLRLFRHRSFAVANLATLVYAMGFFSMLLGNILFLTGQWNYSILRAGLAVTPGPLVVAAVSGPAGKLAARRGFRPVLVAGFAVFALGLSLYALRVGTHPDYLGSWLPATLVSGLGIGLTFPVLGAAAVASLHPDRFAVGSAVNQTARQVGGALGVAVLVVILGPAGSPMAALGHFRHLWAFSAGMAVLAGITSLLLTPTPEPVRAPPLPQSATDAAVIGNSWPETSTAPAPGS